MEEFLEKITVFRKQNQSLLDNTVLFVLLMPLLAMYFYFNAFTFIETSHIVIALIVIGFMSYFKPWVAVIIFMCVHVYSLMFTNVIVASMYLVLYFIISFSLVYYKNDRFFIAIVFLMAMSNNPLLFSFAVVLYCILFAQRGIGFPLGMSALIFLTSLTAKVIGNPIFFEKTIKIGKNIDPIAYLNEYLNSSELMPQFYEHFQTFNIVYISGAIVVFYAWFRYLFSKKEKEEKDTHEINKSVKTAGITLALLLVIYIANTTLYKLNFSFFSIVQIVIGSIAAFAISLFSVRYPLRDTPTFAELEKQKEKEKLEQVINHVEKKKLQIGWDEIAGYEDVKNELKEVLEPYLHKDVMKKMKENHIEPVKGLLLFGAPGTGKTMFAKAIAKESNMNIISVAGAQFTSKWVGESDRNLRNIFEQAANKKPCIIFFDELESFLPKREDAMYNWEKTLVTTFLAQMDGFDKLNDVLVIGATNYPDKIDPAAIRPGRFDKCIYIYEPDVEAKIAILKKYLGETSVLSEADLSEVAKAMERFTAADIESLIKEMYRQKKYEALSKEDIIQACSSYKPTITLDMRDRYESLSEKYNRRFILDNDIKEKKKEHTWNEIAGMDDVKKQIRKMVEKPLLYADKYKELDLDVPKGVLMFGPPGCGKTLFAKVIASECDASFFIVNGPELLSGAVGESEKKLRRVFRDAREQKPSIIFFDEFDSIAQNRDTANGQVKMINQLLTEMDGMEGLEGVMVLAATNRIYDIDPALKRPGRFDNVLYIGLPDLASREKQFAYHLSQFENLDFMELAKQSEHYTCADISGVCRKIKEKKLDALINDVDISIDQALCLSVLANTNRTLSDKEIELYELMRNNERK